VMPHPQRLLFYQKRRSLSTRKFKSFRETKKQGQWGRRTGVRPDVPIGPERGAMYGRGGRGTPVISRSHTRRPCR
jgi:hypothetical protein